MVHVPRLKGPRRSRTMKKNHMRIIISILLALAFTFTFTPGNTSATWDRLELIPSRYTGNSTYVPGETIEMILHASPEDVYNLTIVTPGSENPLVNNFKIGEDGSAKLTYQIGDTTPDGTYVIRVWHMGTIVDEIPYKIQSYTLSIETDRSAYLVGDEIKIFWTANHLKDQTLPPDGYLVIRIWNDTTMLEEKDFRSPAGSTSFEIRNTFDKTANYWVDGWFNDTQAFAKRYQYSRANFTIQSLGVQVNLDKTQYSLGSLMFIDVQTYVGNESASYGIAEPGCTLDIKIYKKNDHSDPLDSALGLTTDSHGSLRHILQLNNDQGANISYTNGTEYEVEVSAYKWDKALNSNIKIASFKISQFPSITLVLSLDKDEYVSGETLFLNVSAVASGLGPVSSFTYIYEVRDGSDSGDLFSRDTKNSYEFSYSILNDFKGWLWLQVTVDDGQGNRVNVTKLVKVNYAIVLVNADQASYLAEDNILISYEVVSTLMTNPKVFYTITDTDNSVVAEGIALGGSFGFIVPDVPSQRYIFTVYASQDGIIVHGEHSSDLFTGYLLKLEFNRGSYSPGDTLAVDYEIIPQGQSRIPSTFMITYGLINGQTITLHTQLGTGRLLYKIPNNIDEGDQVFYATTDIGGSTSEIITIDHSNNPLWYNTIFGIPILTFFILVLVLLCTFMVMRQRKAINNLKYNKILDNKSWTEKRSTVPSASGSAAIVGCANCEKPIEVTTSRRPIEVMCPHCGEIQKLE